MAEKVRLGGMALVNGVLVHGPHAWACAVRTDDGELKVAAEYKRLRAAEVENPILRGPARLAEVFALLPQVYRRLPEAKLPFQRPQVLATMLGTTLAVKAIKGSPRLSPLAGELVGGVLSLVPAALALRGSELAAYHGAEHISIGSYEHGEQRAREHERCGSHLLGPLLASSAVGATLAAKAPAHLRGPARAAAQLGAVAASTELFGWMTRNPDNALSRALAWPGHELQHRFATAGAEPGAARGRRGGAGGLPGARACSSGLSAKRLPPEIFELPVEKMREGYYTDAYFNHTREVLIRDDRHPRVVMQVFQKHDSYLGGIDEAIAVLKLCADDWDDLTVHALYDGDPIEPFEPVLRIEGDYTGFAHLETVYLGVLARRTLITSNVVHVLEAANRKPIIFMPARHDHHRIQTGDGYAAFVGGQVVGAEIGVTSEAQASWWGGRGIGTLPHALIAAYGGNTVLAATKFVENVDPEMHVTVLVDFENDSVQTALEVARALGPRLWGVRLDTSGQLVDRSLWGEMGDFDPRGVNEQLVRKVRDALDRDGFERVKIVVSGGFDVERIRAFEERGVPVDSYGVGSALIRGENDFTGDIVMTDGRPSAKVGRRFRDNPRLELVE